MSSTVSIDNVTDVAVVLLAGGAGGLDHAVLLSGRGTLLGLLGQRPLTEVILKRAVGECLQKSKV